MVNERNLSGFHNCFNRKEKLEAEAKAGSERFEEITKKWESALQKEIPQDLHEVSMSEYYVTAI